MNDRLSRYLLCTLGAGLLSLALLHRPAYADLVTTDRILAQEQAQQERERLKALLGRGDVGKQLQTLGVPPQEAQARVDAMTDEEVRSMAGKVGTLPAGGALGTTDLILILLVVILVVLLI